MSLLRLIASAVLLGAVCLIAAPASAQTTIAGGNIINHRTI